LKYELASGDGRGIIAGAEAAVIASTTLPTGPQEIASPKWQPSAVAAISWKLGPNTGLGMNLGISRPADENDRYTSTWLSAALGVGVGAATSVFIELYGFNREETRGPNTVSVQTGIVYLMNNDLQLDLRVARRLSDSGPDLLLGAGVSWRLGR
jgi:hypothetical protein